MDNEKTGMVFFSSFFGIQNPSIKNKQASPYGPIFDKNGFGAGDPQKIFLPKC